MRIFFLLLVAANLAVFAWFQNFPPAESASDPEPARRQLEPAKIRVLKGKDLDGLVPAGGTAAPAAPAAPAPSAAPAVTAATPATPATAPAAGKPAACAEWGGFAVAEAPKAEQALAPLALGSRLSQRRSEEKAGWWVFIPPQGSRAGAQKKTAELKALGIDEFFVMQDAGKSQWAISLGVFSSEEAAKSRLEALRAKGVRSAQTGERDTQVAKVWFQLRGAELAQLAKLRETAQSFPGTEVRDCP
jgi:hypothetical protein